MKKHPELYPKSAISENPAQIRLFGEDQRFFPPGSGGSYYDVLWTNPSGGNAHHILAHAHIAADLNELNGACVPDGFWDYFDDATGLFETYISEDVAAMKGKNGKERRDRKSVV